LLLFTLKVVDEDRSLETVYGVWTPLGEELFGLPPLDASTLVGFGDSIAISQSTDGTRFMAVGAPHSDYSHSTNTSFPFHNPNGGLVRLFKMTNSQPSWDLIWSFSGNIDESIGFGIDLVNLSPTVNRIAIRQSDKVVIRDVDIEGVATIHGADPPTTRGKLIKLNADGTVMAVASETLNGQKGRVEVYRSSDLGGSIEWDLEVTFDGEESWDRLGFSLVMDGSGTRIAFGMPNKNGETGMIRVYEHNGSDWNQVGTDIVGKFPGSLFGWSLDMSSDGKRIVAGATGSYADGGSTTNARGSILVYEEQGNSWQQVGSDLEGEFTKENFGRVVTMDASGTKIAASSFKYNNHRGRVKLFKYNSVSVGAWDLIAEVRGEATHERMGRGLSSLAMSNDGTILAIGSPLEETGTNKTGKVQVLEEQDVTSQPSSKPSVLPSQPPSNVPSISPSAIPTNSQSQVPSAAPTLDPSAVPSGVPSSSPSSMHSLSPSSPPSLVPSTTFTNHPSQGPSTIPTTSPSTVPSVAPSSLPSIMPTVEVSAIPSDVPTVEPSLSPSLRPVNAGVTEENGIRVDDPSSGAIGFCTRSSSAVLATILALVLL
jgi:hypothetical protein